MGVETGCQLRWKEISASRHWGLLGRGIVSPPAREPSPVGFSGPVLHGPGRQQQSVLGLLGERKGTGAGAPPAALSRGSYTDGSLPQHSGSPDAPPPAREPGLFGFAVLVRTFFYFQDQVLPSIKAGTALTVPPEARNKKRRSVNCMCGAVVQPCVKWTTWGGRWTGVLSGWGRRVLPGVEGPGKEHGTHPSLCPGA